MKKLLSMLLAVIIVSSVILSIRIPASAESLYIRKIVSVVYDDSGSMSGNKWAYANYAMQAFCGMLNSEDQLFITYMHDSQQGTNYEPEKIDLSAGGIQKSVDSIRTHYDSGSTPYSAVEIAYNKLKSVKDSNPNTQYWLVVITDGEFDECYSMSSSETKSFLNDNFKNYTEGVMPNGTNPQVTFLGIGGVMSPDEDHNKGIYTYSASNAAGIIGAMSDMADRISGRTRLKTGDIKKIDDTTVQISSAIPLLNIAVFGQGSQAKITRAGFNETESIPITRSVSLNYPGYSDLVGGAYLLGDSESVIGAGTYNITFDRNVDLDDIIILFEPALEMRMIITVNGKEISDYSELDNLMEKDRISVNCKIYEMGTEKEIDPSLLPPGTKFEIAVSEEGKVVKQSTDQDMLLSDYELKNLDTEITATVTIEGFNPIRYSEKFKPTQYVHKVVYSITSDYGSDVKFVKFDHIATNKDLSIQFTVYADGVAITDPDAVKALNPVIGVSPQGNDGEVTYSDDGKIIFTPNAASKTSAQTDQYDVEVTCTLDNGVSAKHSYTVLISTYQVVPVDAGQPVKKTALYGNQTSVSFYITKDGVKLDKAAVEKHISVALNEEHSALKTNVSVAQDGTITVTPYSEEEHVLTFWNWWINWAYYFGLESKDITVTLNHTFGAANSTIDIVEEDLSYQLLNVYLPLLIEIVLLALLITWIILIVTKPRYVKSATLFAGDIKYNPDNGTHVLRNFSSVKLDKFNKVQKGNGRLKFKKSADIVSANGIRIRADHGGRIICEMLFPWYKSKIEPADPDLAELKTPAAIAEYIIRYKKLEINEFATTVTVTGEFERGIAPANPKLAKYIVVPDSGNGVGVIDGKKVIKSGKLFVYVNE